MDAVPIASPPTSRAVTNCAKSAGRAAPIDEIANKAAAEISSRLRPESVAEESSNARPNGATHKDAAGGKFGLRSVQRELTLQEYDSAVNHCGVKTEQ